MIDLTPTERRGLKARAHHLQPVVMIGESGLTPAVLKEIDANLKNHELIKIRVLGDDRQQRKALIGEICRRLDASPVQHIGKILVVYRPRPPEAQAVRSSTRNAGREKRRSKRSYQMQ